MTLPHIVRLLPQGSKSIGWVSFFQLGIVRFVPDQREVRISMLGAELTGSPTGSVDDLRVVVVSLSLNLMTQVFIIDIGLLIISCTSGSILDYIHHLWPCFDLRSI